MVKNCQLLTESAYIPHHTSRFRDKYQILGWRVFVSGHYFGACCDR